MVQSQNKRDGAFRFWPEAMIPAWVVTDADLIVRECNRPASLLMEKFDLREKLDEIKLSVRIDGLANGVVSFWPNLFQGDDLQHIARAISGVEAHLGAIQSCTDQLPLRQADAIKALRLSFSKSDFVKPYVFGFDGDYSILRAGIKVSPPQGLRLRARFDVLEEEISYEFLDVIIAYQIECSFDANTDQVKSLTFRGMQPALHDATERHRLWEYEQRFKEHELQGRVSHVFKTPLGTAQRLAGSLCEPLLPPDSRERYARQLKETVDDVLGARQE